MADIEFKASALSKTSDANTVFTLSMPTSRPDGDVYVAFVARTMMWRFLRILVKEVGPK